LSKKQKKKKGTSHSSLIAGNKKAFYDFLIIESYEAGIELWGSEIKSVRDHKVNLKDSYARIRNSELFLLNMHISPYVNSRMEDMDSKRSRKLLMHHREIAKLQGKLTDKSLTLVPLKLYFKKNRVKVEIALAKGKNVRDKRKDIMEKEHSLEMRRALKNYQK